MDGRTLLLGDWTPLGAVRQSTQAAWAGDAPQLLHLAVLAVTLAAAGTLAVRRFRAD